jgi:hypothetical protein
MHGWAGMHLSRWCDTGAAREYAVRIISELIDGGGYDDPGLSMIVKDAAERQILAIPFSQFR